MKKYYKKYYMIVENTNEVLYIGEFNSIIDADKAVREIGKDHFDHSYGSILISEEVIPKLITKLHQIHETNKRNSN